MNEIVVDRNSLIPQFLSTYVSILPDDICKLRLMLAFVVLALLGAGLFVGYLLIGLTLPFFSLYMFGTLDTLSHVGPGFYIAIILSYSVVATGVLIFTLALIQEFVDRMRVRAKLRQREQANQPPDQSDQRIRTVQTLKEMYRSLKDKYCLKVRYE